MASFYKNAKLDLTTTGVTTLYTAPSATTAVFKSLLVDDDSGLLPLLPLPLLILLRQYSWSMMFMLHRQMELLNY